MMDGKQVLLEKLRVLLFGWSDCCGVGEGDALGVKVDDFWPTPTAGPGGGANSCFELGCGHL